MLDIPLILGDALAIGLGAGGLLVGAGLMLLISKLIGARSLGDAQRQAGRLIEEAKSEAGHIKKQLELDAREELAKRREEFERELNREKAEIKEAEQRLVKREDNLDRKLDTLTTKERFLDELDGKIKKREQVVTQREAELETLLEEQRRHNEKALEERKRELLRVGGMSEEEARRETLVAFERDVQREAAQLVQRNLQKAEEECRDQALKITLQAIQRYASEHTVDNTVSAIAIPSDDMKGRVIGREGRNIRAFEKTTGVDVIVDDTPGVVVVSCFDPVRRAVAAEALQKLVDDGRIHPARIEEVVENITKEMNQRIIKYGKDAAIEANIQGLHPRVSEMMGRLHFRMSFGQNILKHSIETAYLCQVIADELGLDGALARRCGFLHDIGKAMDHEVEGGHPAIGMEFCKKYNEKAEVLNAIGGHHNDIPSISPYTPIVMAADAISGARPGARRETLEKYVRRLEDLEKIATDQPGVRQAFAIQAGREVRVVVDPERVDDGNCILIARNIAKRVSDEMTFPGEIRITVLRELRTIEFAR
ncbi:MAG: ribonuclease Y [Phycisphaeraceae bacterium]|nr:ribonuclease Y [Phycisphaeraceae bacterium]